MVKKKERKSRKGDERKKRSVYSRITSRSEKAKCKYSRLLSSMSYIRDRSDQNRTGKVVSRSCGRFGTAVHAFFFILPPSVPLVRSLCLTSSSYPFSFHPGLVSFHTAAELLLLSPPLGRQFLLSRFFFQLSHFPLVLSIVPTLVSHSFVVQQVIFF